jgi:uncharacterized DUF497 family protein
MFDLSQIAGFDWDEGNTGKNAEKHNVRQREAEEIFLDPRLLVFVDEKHSGKEPRYHAYGRTTAGRLLQASFTMRQNVTLVRVISVRPMSRRERSRYEEEV